MPADYLARLISQPGEHKLITQTVNKACGGDLRGKKLEGENIHRTKRERTRAQPAIFYYFICHADSKIEYQDAMNLFNEDHLYNDDYLRSLEDNFVARNNDDDREVC